MWRKKKRCTAFTDGRITRFQPRGEGVTLITVQYEVNGVSYEVRESLKRKSQAIKIGFLPIGQRKTPVLPNVAVGSSVCVQYNPEDPAKAFLRDNVGRMNG